MTRSSFPVAIRKSCWGSWESVIGGVAFSSRRLGQQSAVERPSTSQFPTTSRQFWLLLDCPGIMEEGRLIFASGNPLIMAASRPKYCYRVDTTDRLVWVDAWWLAFAAENGAHELTEQSVLGRSLWDFVDGTEPRRLYEEIHARVRRTSKAIVLPFRCDSPTLQRHMRLTIALGEKGELHYESILLRVEPQRILTILDPQQSRTDAKLTMCSSCKRALLEPVGWLEVEDVSVRLLLFESRRVPQLCYTICPNCAVAMGDSPPNGNAAYAGGVQV